MKKLITMMGICLFSLAQAEGMGDIMVSDFAKEQQMAKNPEQNIKTIDNNESIHGKLHSFYLQQLQKREALKQAALEKTAKKEESNITNTTTSNVQPVTIATPMPAFVNQENIQQVNVPKLRVIGTASTDMKVDSKTGTITLPNGTVITPKYTTANLNN